MTVWLLERHALPLVAVMVGVPSGGSSDPKGKAGVAEEAAAMLTSGAGKRSALEFDRAVDDLGASIASSATSDTSYLRLSVTKKNFAPAMQLLGDAAVRPRMDAAEWKRVHDLWANELDERQSDPEALAGALAPIVLFGPDHPYGHPTSGLPSAAPRVGLADAKRFYEGAWRPDRAVVVAVGDVTKDELDAQLVAAFGAWKAPPGPALPVVTPAAPASDAASGSSPRIFLVDRADAAQAVIYALRAGPSALDASYPLLARANIAVGGGFTSRLNEDLRVKHGWTYGAESWVPPRRGTGIVRAGGGFVTASAVDALSRMLADFDEAGAGGLTEAEEAKTRVQAREDSVEEYETVGHAAGVLIQDALLGLPPDYEAKAAVATDQADLAALNGVVKTYFQHFATAVVIVGPRAKLEAPLAQAGFSQVTVVDAEGNPIKAQSAAKDTAAGAPGRKKDAK
jgi:predicted Zn-dependent peptidase